MALPEIGFSSEINRLLPRLKLGQLAVSVVVQESSAELKEEINRIITDLESKLDGGMIRNMPAVKAAKDAYRVLGKDPNRYRPAAESLLRRVSSGKGIYRINNVVDCLNLVSVKTGFSICGYDWEKIEGDIRLGIGKTAEPYKGIGRGDLNIENLPVFRDAKGAFGTPTSDALRTLIDEKTTNILMLIPAFHGDEKELNTTLKMLADYFYRFAEGKNAEIEIINNG